VAEITGGAPILRGVDSVGGETADQVANLLAPNGTLVSFGAMSGKPLVISASNLIFKQGTVRGFWGSKRVEATPADERARVIASLIAAIHSGDLKLPVDEAFDIADAAKAAQASDRPGRSGKIVLTAA
jgi:NADPH:quinone reductase-like Zn-dependent oxidoreductase